MNRKLLDSVEEKIRKKCASLNLDWGHHCSLLYSPVSTFSKETELWFIGLNPGSDQKYRDQKCSFSPATNKNSYYSEGWKGERCEQGKGGKPLRCEQYPNCEHGMNDLQREVTKLFKRLVEKIDPGCSQEQFASLMDITLTANFFPFASSGWKNAVEQMRIRPEIELSFAEEIWEEILQEIHPRVMVVMSSEAVEGFFEVFNNRLGWEQVGSTNNIDTNWFDTRRLDFTVTKFMKGDKKTSLVGIPHLSRFRVFSNDKCKKPSEDILNKITNLFTDNLYQLIK